MQWLVAAALLSWEAVFTALVIWKVPCATPPAGNIVADTRMEPAQRDCAHLCHMFHMRAL